jgi:hypothetical protein
MGGMQMRKIGVALAGAAAVALSVAAAARADYTRYFGPAILVPGTGAASAYDTSCNRWTTNEMVRNIDSRGTVTFIDTGGGWHFTSTSGGTNTVAVVQYRADWTKKAYCYNGWLYSYWANCWRGGATGFSCNPV